jgi:hypothetical protein
MKHRFLGRWASYGPAQSLHVSLHAQAQRAGGCDSRFDAPLPDRHTRDVTPSPWARTGGLKSMTHRFLEWSWPGVTASRLRAASG